MAIPNHRRFALIGDSDGGQVAGAEVALLHGLRNYLLGAAPDFFGIVLDPAGLRINLLVFFLGNRDDSSGLIENDEAGAGRALIDGADIAGHCTALPFFALCDFRWCVRQGRSV